MAEYNLNAETTFAMAEAQVQWLQHQIGNSLIVAWVPNVVTADEIKALIAFLEEQLSIQGIS